jgi:hypothetical protein
MNTVADDSQESDVPALAVRALKAAQTRARQAGRPLVLVVNRQLVRVANGQTSVLKVLPARRNVGRRTLRIKP